MPDRYSQEQCSLPFVDWPLLDQESWRGAFLEGDLLYDNGPLVHWAERTQHKARKNYGHWLTHLIQTGQLQDNTSLEDRITKETVNHYLKTSGERLAVTTNFMRLADLLSLAQAFAPETDWEWLRRIRRRLEARLCPSKNKDQKIVHSTHLWQLGLDLMAEAETNTSLGPRTAALNYRDGLLIALLSARPLRMKNMTSLEIGSQITRLSEGYQIDIPAEETKTKRAIYFDVPDDLTSKLDTYIDKHRPALLRGIETDRLWISLRGTIAIQHALACAIRTRTRKALGQAITPHLFRDCAATSLTQGNPEHVRSAAALLGHGSLKTTLNHYDQSKMLEASSRHQENLLDLRQRMRNKIRQNSAETDQPIPETHSQIMVRR